MQKMAAIIGCGAVKIGRYPDRLENELALEAIRQAILDAGIKAGQVEGIFTTPDLRNDIGLQVNMLCEYLRIVPKSMLEVCCGGAAGGMAIKTAVQEILLGRIDVAVCYGAEREGTLGWFKNFETDEGSTMNEPSALQPYGSYGVIWAYAMSARRYMYETGAKEEHFAMAAVRNRRNAQYNPLAAFRNPVTVEDILQSRPLCTPIKLLDSSASLDGAAAVVVASTDFARRVCKKPVYILGWGQYHDNSCIIPTDRCDKPISTFDATRKAAEAAFQMTGIGPWDVDVAEVYAPFSPHELMVPEDIGWYEKGGMIRAIENGETGVGGKIPVNTDGGVISRGHPWGATPLYETINLVRQLKGEAGANQVEGAGIGLMHCEGGVTNNGFILILGSDK